MAEATVSIEAVIHTTLAKFAEDIYQEHGVRIDSVSFSWRDVLSLERDVQQVSDVRLISMMKNPT